MSFNINSFKLEGRRALITGSGQGIGLELARGLGAAGATVVINTRNIDKSRAVAAQLRDEGLKAESVAFDVTDREQLLAAINTFESDVGAIDILVNNAGMLTQARCVDLTLEMWNDMLRVDLTSVFVASQRALPHMLAQRWGRIINVASQLGIKGGAELTHYAAAKAGVIGFTKSLALEVAKDNVLVNAIAPGPIETPLVGGISEAWKRAKAAELPLGRFGLADEVAPTAVLLASEPGGNLFVGQTLGPNSGDVMP